MLIWKRTLQRLWLWQCVVLVLYVSWISGIRVENCTPTRELRENTSHTVRCSGFRSSQNDTIRWLLIQGWNNVTDAGSCQSFQPFKDYFYRFRGDCTSPLRPNISVDYIYRRGSFEISLSNVTRAFFGNSTLICAKEGKTPEKATCRLNVVYPADLGSCTYQVLGLTWTLMGSCDVRKMYSSTEMYSCKMQEKWNGTYFKDTPGSTTIFKRSPFIDTTSGLQYFNGTCDFSIPLPSSYGNVIFSVNVTPGSSMNSTGANFSIEHPADPELVSCSSAYLPENDFRIRFMECMCRTNSLGSPPGRLVWMAGGSVLYAGSYGQTTLRFPGRSVSRYLTGTDITCLLDWIESKNVSFTLHIAYGPDKLVIQSRGFFNPDDLHPLFFTCIPSSINPPNQYRVEWTGLCLGQSGSACMVTPRYPDDEGKSVSCTVINIANHNRSSSTTIRLRSEYPPVDPPVITGIPNHPLFEGDIVNLTCGVKGGKPPVSSITISCPGLSPNSNVTGTGQQVLITFQIKASYNLSKCVCSARWQQEDAYKLSATAYLSVFMTTAAVTTEVAGQCRAVFKCAREFQGKIRSPDTTRVDVCRAVDDYVTCYLNNCHGEETLPDAQKNFLQREMGKKGFDCEIPSSLKTSTTVVTTSTALITTAILATTSPPQSDLSSTDAPSLTEVGESVETQSTQGISLATDDTTLESLYTWTTDDVGSADTLSTQRDADEYETTSIDQVTSAEAYDGESEITFSIEDEKEVSSLDTWTSDTWISGTASVKETVSTTGAIEKDEDIKKPSEQEDTKLTTAEFNKALGTLDAVLADNTTFSNTSTSEKVVTVISELMRADVTQFKESSTDSVSAASRVLQVVDNLLEKVELTDGQFMSTAPNLIVAAREVNASTFTGLALITNADEKDLETPEFQSSPTVAENVNRVSSLALPASLLSSVSNATEVRISMTVHRTAVLFEAIRRNVSRPANSSDYVREINSHVLSASVVGFHITNMTDPVTIVLAHHKQNSVGPECVFWDSNINDWSTEGCWMKKENITDSRTICECNHLTNFALLMDVYSTGSSVGETDRKILSVVSYIGCGASLLALLLTLITYGVFGGFRNVRRPSLQERNQRDNPSKILLNLCVALALTNLVFMAGMHDHAFKSLPACKFVAAFLHFSLLAALGWMAVEAVYMYLALVLVFKTNYNNFLLKCSLAGWGAPLVITVITLGVNKTDNYGMLDSGVCWLKGNAFYIAFLAPICAILLMNFIVFGLVMRRIMGLSERKLNKSDTYTAKKQLRGAVGVVILLGLTWVFAIFAIDRASIVFNYLFAIFNSLQGLFIFLYNCLLKKEIRTAWMNKFRWIRMREETTDLTTSKANYLRVTNIGTSTGKSEQYPDDSTACSAVADTSVNEAHSTMIEMTSSTQDSDKATPTQSANTPNDVLDINPLTSTAKEPSLTTVDESTSAATDTDVCTSESETKVLATCGPGPDISTPQSRTNTDTPVNGQTNMMSCTFQLTTNIITTAAPVGDVNVAPPILTVPTVSMDTLADTTIPVIVDTPLYISTLNVPPLQVSSSDI